MSISQHAADTFRPPELSSSSDHKVHQASTSNSAAEAALALPRGKFYVTFCALTVDCYVAFKPATSVAAVTTTTGYPIPAGQERSWFIESNRLAYVETITASASGTLKWYVSSPVFEKPVL